MTTLKTHMVVYIPAGLFKTACGLYLDGPDKERGAVFHNEITCKNCQRTVSKWRLRKCCFSSSTDRQHAPNPHQLDCPERPEWENTHD